MSKYLLLILMCANWAVAATDAKELEKPLQDSLIGRMLILRGLPTDKKLSFDADLKPTRVMHKGDWTTSQIRVDNVAAKGDSLTITGKRTNAGDERNSFSAFNKVEITIKGPFSKFVPDFVKDIETRIFLTDPKELAAAVPAPWLALFAGFIVPDKDGPKSSVTLKLPQTDDLALSSPGVVGKLATGDYFYRAPKYGVKPPKAVFQPDPEYSEEARKKKYQGKVVFLVIVDKTGSIYQVYFAIPAGLGFDENALRAMRQWRFEPATKEGAPVASLISVEMSFNLY